MGLGDHTTLAAPPRQLTNIATASQAGNHPHVQYTQLFSKNQLLFWIFSFFSYFFVLRKPHLHGQCKLTKNFLEKDGEPWFVLKDVCGILSIGNVADVYARLDTDEKGVGQIDTLGGRQNMSISNESGLYNVILRSEKPEALIPIKLTLPTAKAGGFSVR